MRARTLPAPIRTTESAEYFFCKGGNTGTKIHVARGVKKDDGLYWGSSLGCGKWVKAQITYFITDYVKSADQLCDKCFPEGSEIRKAALEAISK